MAICEFCESELPDDGPCECRADLDVPVDDVDDVGYPDDDWQ